MRPLGGETTCVPDRTDKNVDFEGPRIDHFCTGSEAARDGSVNVRFGKRTAADGEAVWRKEAFLIWIRGRDRSILILVHCPN